MSGQYVQDMFNTPYAQSYLIRSYPNLRPVPTANRPESSRCGDPGDRPDQMDGASEIARVPESGWFVRRRVGILSVC